ncbi:MAG: hypothetical protein AAF600_02600 [Bacteroidota bacterium]
MKDYKVHFITIACALIAIIGVAYPEEIKEYGYLVILLVIFLVIAAFFGPFIVSFIKRQVVEGYTNFIYEHYKSTLEYNDEAGKKVNLNTTIYVSKLSLRWGKNTTNEILTDGLGKVFPEFGKGINVDLISGPDNTSELSYSTVFSKKNVLRKQHYTSFAVNYIDTFNQNNSSFWQIGPKHHCKYYEFVLIYPNLDKNINLIFRKGTKCDDGRTCKDWVVDNNTTYSTYTRFGKKVAKVLYYNIPNTEMRSISWEFI